VAASPPSPPLLLAAAAARGVAVRPGERFSELYLTAAFVPLGRPLARRRRRRALSARSRRAKPCNVRTSACLPPKRAVRVKRARSYPGQFCIMPPQTHPDGGGGCLVGEKSIRAAKLFVQ